MYRISKFHFKQSVQNHEGKINFKKPSQNICRKPEIVIEMLEEMHEVHASDILSAWDRSQPQEEDLGSMPSSSATRRYDVHVLIRSRDVKEHPIPSMGLVYLAT